MSNLVIRNMNEVADENAPVIYADAIVNDGTLFALDFSNRGMLSNYDLSRGVRDLAEGTPVRSGIITLPEIAFNDTYTPSLPPLTDDRGFPTLSLAGGGGLYSSGLMIQGVGKYLYDNQPNCLLVTWVKTDMSAENINISRFLRLGQSGGNGHALSVYFNNADTPIVNIVMGGKSGTGNLEIVDNEYTQIAVEFRGDGVGNRYYVNGVLAGTSSTTEGEFGEPLNDDILALGGNPSPNGNSPGTIYHASLHDLDVAALSAQEIVNRNYEYVNGIGRYEGLSTRRPYANIPLVA